MRGHVGNGKIERLIRTTKERLRANKQIVLTKEKLCLSEISYALRLRKKKDGKSPFEKQIGKEPKTANSNVVNNFLDISRSDLLLVFQSSNIQDDLDSTVSVRERVRGSKMIISFRK